MNPSASYKTPACGNFLERTKSHTPWRLGVFPWKLSASYGVHLDAPGCGLGYAHYQAYQLILTLNLCPQSLMAVDNSNLLL